MNIRCNAGMTSTNLQGWRGDFPKPVWYNPKGVVNIMSLFVVKKYYRIQYDNYKEQDALRVTKLDGSIMVFTPTAKGLYALRTGSTGWTHVNTVMRHLPASKVQNILMFPATCTFTKIANMQLIANLPIGHANIAVAERNFGPNLRSLKGKTVKRASVPVEG
jgi:hypothetical protein